MASFLAPFLAPSYYANAGASSAGSAQAGTKRKASHLADENIPELTSVPADLSSLSTERKSQIIRILLDERTELVNRLASANKKAKTAASFSSSSSSSSSSAAVAAPALTAKQIETMKKSWVKKIAAAIKRTKIKTHSQKPKLEIQMGVSLSDVKAILGDIVPDKDTKALYCADVSPYIYTMLPTLPEVFECEWTGKVWVFKGQGGRLPKQYRRVVLCYMKVHYTKKENLLRLKFQVEQDRGYGY